MTPEQVQGLVRGELSRRARGAHAALLVFALGMATVVVSLWVTEASLPLRTHIAFGLMAAIAFAWSGHAIWVLTHSAVLLVPHQVQAARLALVCCAVFLAGCVLVWFMLGGAAALTATATAIVMLVVAALTLYRARARHLMLLRRRSELS